MTGKPITDVVASKNGAGTFASMWDTQAEEIFKDSANGVATVISLDGRPVINVRSALYAYMHKRGYRLLTSSTDPDLPEGHIYVWVEPLEEEAS